MDMRVSCVWLAALTVSIHTGSVIASFGVGWGGDGQDSCDVAKDQLETEIRGTCCIGAFF